MKREDYLADSNVSGFVSWLANNHNNIKVLLNIPPSPKVPGGVVNAEATIGLEKVVAQYNWLGLSWTQTVTKLSELAASIQDHGHSNERALAACIEIIEWGGERNPENGARPFLNRLAAEGSLVEYLEETRKWFALSSAALESLTPVEEMNSMLTKVHALNSGDGLPIYDTRVAGSIASLVELWRVMTKQEGQPLPELLKFRYLYSDKTRRVRRLFPTAQQGGIYYTTAPQVWAESKIRLGWIIGKVLEQSTSLFASEGDMQKRMHAFEASLFMIGYDVASYIG